MGKAVFIWINRILCKALGVGTRSVDKTRKPELGNHVPKTFRENTWCSDGYEAVSACGSWITKQGNLFYGTECFVALFCGAIDSYMRLELFRIYNKTEIVKVWINPSREEIGKYYT